jgi:hypothetical protein
VTTSPVADRESLAALAVQSSPAGLLSVALGAVGCCPDPWQLTALSSTSRRLVIVAARQVGKGSVAAARALHLAAFTPEALVLIVSATERQARIVLARIRGMLPYVGTAAAGAEDTQTEVRFRNGSRIIVLPASSTSLRGWTAHLLLVDEGAYVPRSSWEAVVPTTAATGGAIVCLTSAGSPAGWLYEIVSDEDTYPEWERHLITAWDVPRIDRAFLEGEQRRLPRAVFEREYECKFTGAEDGVFDPVAVAGAFAASPRAHHLDLDLTAVLLGQEETDQ